MKIMHTGDWHIGKVVNEFHMTEDQEFVLGEITNIIKEEKPDVLVIAGDLYDRSVAPVEAVELLDKMISKILIDLHTPVIAIAGNHDSPQRLSFGSEIFKRKGLYIGGTFKKDVEKVVLKDEYGPVNFYLVPYADPAVVRDTLKDESIKNHDDAMKAIIEEVNKKIDLNERNVLVTHGFVRGGSELELSDSERPLSIGGTDCVDVNYFKEFNYTALGHLHGPQKVECPQIRYSGSIMKYSFSEARQKKSVTIVNMDEHGHVDIELKYLHPKRDMRVIKGKIDDLLKPEVYTCADTEDYISAILTDEGEIMDPVSKLRAVYPNIMLITRESKMNKNEKAVTSAGRGFEKKSELELFKDFYENITGREFTEQKSQILSEIIEQTEKSERSYGI